MTSAAERTFLADHGWHVFGASFDMCWLECSEGGYLRTWKSGTKVLCICLCAPHAMVLERGAWGRDYSGAPLPPESMAAEWPWRPCEEVGVAAL
jgi:hypothetical protein